jgi:hypothetical protein
MRFPFACVMLFSLLALAFTTEHCRAQEKKKLGWLSAQEEVGNNGADTISPGKFKKKDPDTGAFVKDDDGNYVYVEDKGGPSYGSYQLASKRGIDGSSVNAFVKQYYRDEFTDQDALLKGQSRLLDPIADKERFDKKWKEVVKSDGDLFLNNEHQFIYDTHYLPVAREIKKRTGLDVDTRSEALRNVLWSVAVQNGPPSDPKATGVKLLEEALKKWDAKDLKARPGADGKGGVSDEDIINAIYDERSRKNDDGKMVYFPNLDLTSRFKRERGDAQAARSREKLDAEAADLNKTKLGELAKGVGIIAGPVRKKSPELFVDRGQPTFEFSGYDRDFSTTRKPAVPNNRSGVRIGRGYDLSRVTKDQALKDLRAAGLSDTQVEIFAKAAGLRGEDARKYLNSFNYARLYQEAKDKGLKGQELNQYTIDNSPNTITLPQQKKLFELSYARAEEEAKTKLFPDFDKYPAAAKEAITDMVFDRGADDLLENRLGFVTAVRDRNWASAADLSKRQGAGVARNEATKKLFESIPLDVPPQQK